MEFGFLLRKNKEDVFMNWKKVVSVLLVSAMTLSMAACGDTASTSDSAAGTESKGSTSKAEASSDDKLVVWTLSNDLIDFGDKFQEATGVEVDTVVIEPADYQHYLLERKNRISSLVSQRC
jgi:multiple sugar transport system substrate-binding protein